jgi:plastocyanin
MRRFLPILSVAAVFAGCGGGSDAMTQDAAPEQATVRIASFKYAPPTLTVAKGARVTFVNEDKAPHTATARDGRFDTGTLKKGDRKALTLDKPGRYRYTCSFHAFMEGEIVVK